MNQLSKESTHCVCKGCEEFSCDRDFHKIADLKDAGLEVRRHKIRNKDLDESINYTAEKQKKSEEPVVPPAAEVYIVHSTSSTELSHEDLMRALEINGITCERCKRIYERGQKLLQNVSTLNKDNNILGICTHCYLKAQGLGPCTKCVETVKKSADTIDDQILYKKKPHNAWLSKVNRLLDDIIINETPRNVSPSKRHPDRSADRGRLRFANRAHSDIVYINDLHETPPETASDIKSKVQKEFDSQIRLSDTDVGKSATHCWDDTKGIIKQNKTRHSKPIFYTNNWQEDKYATQCKDKDDTIDMNEKSAKQIKPQRYGGVDSPSYVDINKILHQAVHDEYFNNEIIEPMKFQYFDVDDESSKLYHRKRDTPHAEQYKRDIIYTDEDDISVDPMITQYRTNRNLDDDLTKTKEKYSVRLAKDKHTKHDLNKGMGEPKKSEYNIDSKVKEKYTKYVQDIRDLNEKFTSSKKSKSLDSKASKHTFSGKSLNIPSTTDKTTHFIEGNINKRNVDKPATDKRTYDKLGSDKHTVDKKTIGKRSMDKLTPDSSKQLKVLKSSKHPKKIESDETMITSISRATVRSRQKDLVYFFPKDLKKKTLQPNSYVSSSTLIKKTRQKIKSEEGDRKRRDAERKRKLEEDTKKTLSEHEKDLSEKPNQTANTPVSTAATTVTKTKVSPDQEKNKSTRGSQKGQDEKMSKMAKLLNQQETSLKDKSKQKDQHSVKKTEVSFTDVDKLDLKKTIAGDKQDFKNKNLEVKPPPPAKDLFKLDRIKDTVDPAKIKLFKPSNAELMVQFRETKAIGPIPTVGSAILRTLSRMKRRKNIDPYISSNTELGEKQELGEFILSENIVKCKPLLMEEPTENKFKPTLYQTFFDGISPAEGDGDSIHLPRQTRPVRAQTTENDESKGIIKYALSDRAYIEKGWTMLPTEKVVRRMNVYRMRPARPDIRFFENNKNKEPMYYDTGEKFAEFDENGRGQLYYKNGRLALDYYDAKESNAQQRFVIYSTGDMDKNGRTYPITVLGTFDYLGNGVVLDHVGKIRLKYNQTEGVVLDRGIGPVSHWKWHALNDPPVLQQVMIDTATANKDPEIIKLGLPLKETEKRPDNEDMLAIEFENFVREKKKKLAQEYKPYQIKMKALKINDHFSLKVLDQATVYLIYRDGLTNVKINIGMLLDHREIVDTDTAELGEVANNIERLPSRSDSLAGLRRAIGCAQHTERVRADTHRKFRLPKICSADKIVEATSRPLQCPLQTISDAEKCCCNSKYCMNSLFNNTRIM